MVQKRKLPRNCIDYPGRIFKPIKIPMTKLKQQILTKEEITALYYADLKGLKQNDAAERMGISQSSFSRDLNEAHKKVAYALFHGEAILFETEPIENNSEKTSK
ncbi:MAG: DUF134 domain-containing protein [Candidatus Heimdallarchaeaceae archaeon]